LKKIQLKYLICKILYLYLKNLDKLTAVIKIKSSDASKINLNASQIYKKNNPNRNKVNFKNLNNITKATVLNKTPLSGNSQHSISTNFNKNNFIIKNKYEASDKSITNLNMIFKLKNILNEGANANIIKLIKIDATKIISNPSSSKSKHTSTNSNNDKSSSVYFKSNYHNNNILNINNYKSNSSNLLQNKKNMNMNSTFKSSNSTSKSKANNLGNNNNSNNNNNNNNINYTKFDSLKYNQHKDFINPNFQRNSSKSKSRSKCEFGNFGKNGKI
jgi:hypothetical protein